MSKKEFVPEEFNRALDEEPREETQAERDAKINAELTTAKYEPEVVNPGTDSERVVHDTHGNVRNEVTDLGIGTVTVQDVVSSGKFEFRKRDDGLYDIYNLNGTLVVVGASAADLSEYQK